MSAQGKAFRQLLLAQDAGLPLVLPGVVNALSALVVENLGFKACYVSGAGVSNSYLGLPDLGLLTFSELADHVAAMSDVTSTPLIVDADTGFGNALNVQRTVRRLEAAGAAGIQLEDQVLPKKCGHFAGKQVIETHEMIGKIHAALDARRDDSTVIIARTDAAAVHGLGAACGRAAAYADAGADLLFVEAPRSRVEMQQIIDTVPGAHVANMVEGDVSPLCTQEELGEMGYSVALYANAGLRGAVLGMEAVLKHLFEHGDTLGAGHLMISWVDRQKLVKKDQFEKLEQKYGSSNG